MDSLQQKQYGRYLLEWDRKLLRNNMLPSDNTRFASQRLLQLRQTICHPYVCSKSRADTLQEDYVSLHTGCINRKVSCLRDLCHHLIELGKGRYEHERLEIEAALEAIANAEGHDPGTGAGVARPACTRVLGELGRALAEIERAKPFLESLNKPTNE